eukprot:8632523-Alexandrium_andersonii.AAC.1
MSASLVGSEMCIRDRPEPISHDPKSIGRNSSRSLWLLVTTTRLAGGLRPCLLYTSDAADDM